MKQTFAERISFRRLFQSNRSGYLLSAFWYSKLSHVAGFVFFLVLVTFFREEESFTREMLTIAITGSAVYGGILFLFYYRKLGAVGRWLQKDRPSPDEAESAVQRLLTFPRQSLVVQSVCLVSALLLPALLWSHSPDFFNALTATGLFTLALDFLVTERLTHPLLASFSRYTGTDLHGIFSIKNKFLLIFFSLTAALIVNLWTRLVLYGEKIQQLIAQKSAKLPILTDVETSRLIYDILASSLFLCAAFALTGWLAAYGFSRTLARLGVTLASIREGQFESADDTLLPDESGVLTAQLNCVIRTVQERIQQLQTHSSEMNAASNLMADISSEQNQSLVRQSTSVAQTSSTLQELLESSKQISESASSVVNFAEDTEKHALNGLTNMSSTVQLMTAVRDQNHISVSDIIQLSEAIQEIEQVLNFINSIADETNLIALNAAIEASSAGEYGLRFKIVANEVRGLSDRVTKSIQNIQSIIEKIQDATSRLVVAAQENSEKVEDTYQSSQLTYRYFQEISEWAKKSADAAKQIYVAIQQQRIANQQISVSFNDISSDIIELAASSEKYKQYAVALKKFSSGMENVMAYFKFHSNDNGLFR